jgi:hypothetical protein
MKYLAVLFLFILLGCSDKSDNVLEKPQEKVHTPATFDGFKILIFPSFGEIHSVNYNAFKGELSFKQLGITTINFSENDEVKQFEDFKRIKKFMSKRFQIEITKEERLRIQEFLDGYKNSGYSNKNIKTLDGGRIIVTINEVNNSVSIETNNPQGDLQNLFYLVFNLCDKYALDSITKNNIKQLKGHFY